MLPLRPCPFVWVDFLLPYPMPPVRHPCVIQELVIVEDLWNILCTLFFILRICSVPGAGNMQAMSCVRSGCCS
jgi:hypothetical protein